MSGPSVEVGFTDPLNNPLLFAPEHFPSKIGGHPAWLNPSNLPAVPLCSLCGDPLIFFAQIYAGLDRPSNGFHRTLYMFVCTRGSCYSDNQQPVRVFRSQLAADNPFYSVQPVPEGDADVNEIGENKSFAQSHNGYTNICGMCGCKAPLKCGKCQAVHYCSKTHQKEDWHDHKLHCTDQPSIFNKPAYLSKSSLLFKEFDIMIDREKGEEDLQMDPEELARIQNSSDGYDISGNDAESLSKEYGQDSDPTFTKFKERISRDPSQVLRYARHDAPLWPVPTSQCDTAPPCAVCHEPRSFEVQFLPSLLYLLGVGKQKDDMDWATIVVYSCSKDCEVEDYVEEFAWTQTYPSIPTNGS